MVSCLALAAAAWADPLPDKIIAYSCNCIPNMPAVSDVTKRSLAEGSTLTQTFVPRADAFLAAFNAQDSNGVHSASVSAVTLTFNAWQNTASTFNLALSRVEAGGARTLLCAQDFLQRVQGRTAYTFTFSNAVPVSLDQQHELAVTLVQCGVNTYGGPAAVDLQTPTNDYPDGACSAGSDLWFGLAASPGLPVFTNLNISEITTNAYFFDTSTNQDSTSYDNLRGKFLGVNSHPEQLKFTCPAAWAPTFVLADTNLATLQAQGSSGTNTITLNGLAEGETFLFAKSGATVVGYLKVQSHPRRTINLAYAYVRFPTESSNWAYTAYSGITSHISTAYAKVNLGINWTNDGVLTFNWDLNNDGSSYTAAYDEVWSPMTYGVLPTMERFFSNLYGLRDGTNANTYGQSNGGGTSSGLGPQTVPPRGAMVRVNLLSRTPDSLGSTLAHELGHNLGLWHVAVGTPATDNLMDVGRYADNLYSWQWTVIHNTLSILFDVPPTVALTAPTDGASFLPLAPVNLSASILTNRNPITRVEFRSGGTNLLGVATNAPYACIWTNGGMGNYALTAVVSDNQWMTSTSAVVNVVVAQPPTITLTSPDDGSGYAAPAAINFATSITTNGNTINKVQFFSGTNLLGEAATPPYVFSWTGVVAGVYTLKARLNYNAGSTLDSAGALVTVTNAPRVPPTIATCSTFADGRFVLGGAGPAGQTYILEAATNVTAPVSWVRLATNVAGAGGLFGFTDAQATNYPGRFYRTVTP
jgi:hypothetical protein